MRLKRMEMLERQRQMFGAIAQRKDFTRLGIVQPDTVIELHQRAQKKKTRSLT
jgi:hypothetical protein